jgi:hypothetical protein
MISGHNMEVFNITRQLHSPLEIGEVKDEHGFLTTHFQIYAVSLPS